ncbi:MAG TPA: hypothetical protein VHX68_03885 [Planctomycetaceae bacterium]|jgi:hypothetical protein|nr:hypothetical protein [Planctomycetaceae bacterium]
MKTARLILTLAVFAILPGCGYLVCGYHNVAGWTSRQWSAEKAWQSRKWIYADMPCRGSFKAGFKAGYRFANGGYDSCEPPQYRHYWRIGSLTETERLNAQAWSDGFTHGTVAAQQDHAVGPSALDTATMQPPPGVPDVRYYSPPQMSPDMGLGSNQYWQNGPATPPYEQPPMMPGSGYPSPMGQNAPYAPGAENFQYAPVGNNNSQYSPPPVPVPAPASEAMPAPPSPSPTRGMQLPPPAPASVPTTAAEYFPTRMMASEAYPGIGGLTSVANPQPAPAAEAVPQPVPSMASPPPQATQAADWELPVIRN